MLANRIEILRKMQEKTERSILEAKLKARKIKEISMLKELQMVQVNCAVIDAIKVRIQKRGYLEKILEEKKRALVERSRNRDRVVAMEHRIQNHIREALRQREEKIRSDQLDAFRDVQRQLRNRNKRVRELEGVESGLVQRLEQARNVHYQEATAIQPFVDALEPRSSFERTMDTRKTGNRSPLYVHVPHKGEHNRSFL